MFSVSYSVLFVVLTVPFLLGSIFFVGIPLSRRFQLSADESLACAAVFGLLLVYFSQFLGFVLSCPSIFAWGYASLALGVAVFYRSSIIYVCSSLQAKLLIRCFLIFVFWLMLFSLLVRCFSGGNWALDWNEHWYRAMFFSTETPDLTVKFNGISTVPSRPPLANVICGYALSIFGRHFYIFQAALVLLNSLIIIPAFLFAKRFRKGSETALVLTFLCLSPYVVQNCTYPWTKAIAAFFVLTALFFYLEAWEKNDAKRMWIAWISVAGGLLSHYSAGPYALVLAFHYLLFVLPFREKRIRELCSIAVSALLLIGTWIVWCWHFYGAKTTFLSNTSAEGFLVDSSLGRIGRQMHYSFVPHFFRDVPDHLWSSEIKLAVMRDYAFLLYQTNLWFAFGSLGALLLLWILFFARRDWTYDTVTSYLRSERFFWMMFVPLVVFLGIAVVGGREIFGVAHICLHSVVVLGLCLVAAHFSSLPFVLRIAALVGLLVDFLLGIGLHISIQAIPLWDLTQDGVPMKRHDLSRLLGGSVDTNLGITMYRGLIGELAPLLSFFWWMCLGMVLFFLIKISLRAVRE